ncbi:DAK2 domain-containing protein [Streptomyces sp. SL13]|uniref:DAK2 domain-containing protein n=1 Tax=Streptantibioticus silvisoli TaxID=2705255 RepID=A0AA90GUT8_9ACTN|nr:DAK2 domain-containing protein [Streptantibioticus silvisoli]MDI5968463.1 DAK2 domain-containing protein [Streptantibioticus silvisoli]
MPHTLDAATVRTWCGTALRRLGRAREEIDAINVYPVADGDTGTNLYLTVDSAARALDAAWDAAGHPGRLPLPDAVRALAHGALIGARGNSGTILAQLLRGMSEELAERGDAEGLRRALRRAAAAAYQAVAHPVEGTMLTVAAAAADAADRALAAVPRDVPAHGIAPEAVAGGPLGAVAAAAHRGARDALAATPGQLGVLERAGVVDAGGRGLVVVLAALTEAISGHAPDPGPAPVAFAAAASAGAAFTAAATACAEVTGSAEAVRDRAAPDASAQEDDGPAFEVIYLLEAPEDAVGVLRARLDALGDSLVVVGGDGLWNVHVHVDDAGAAIEAGVEAGRPYRIRVTHFGDAARHRPQDSGGAADRARAVVAVVEGDGLAALYAEAGALPVPHRDGRAPGSADIADAVRGAGAREVVLLPCDDASRDAAAAAAEQVRADGVRVALIPTRSAVQGIAALAVHQPGRRFDEDVVAMTAAAGATRFAELAVAEHESWTMAGVCQAGDTLGMIDGDVAVIGGNLVETGSIVLDRMLAAGGEMVTLVLGSGAPDDLADRLRAHVQSGHLAVDTVVHPGGQHTCPLLIGVE